MVKNVKNLSLKSSSSSVLKTNTNSTHLILNDKALKQIMATSIHPALRSLYLHDNAIEKIENLQCAKNVEYLYLHGNRIAKIEGLETLKNLKKLYLAQNSISVVEGLGHLRNLEELSIEKQHLPNGDSFCFEPRTILGLADTLRILNIAQNRLDSLNAIGSLQKLEVLNAAQNQLQNLDETCSILGALRNLTELNLIGNPITKQGQYQAKIIASALRLESLDNAKISDFTKVFMYRFIEEKKNRARHRIP